MSQTNGIYSIGGTSGTMAAALGAGSNIYSFRWGAPSLVGLQAALRRIIISAGDTSTAFTAGVFTFNAFFARSFTASQSGGTGIAPVANDGKLRTRYPTSQIADLRISSTAALSGSSFTLDNQPFASLTSSDPATAGDQILAPSILWEPDRNSKYPAVFELNEGFVIQATVPATGTWTFSVHTLWEEGAGF